MIVSPLVTSPASASPALARKSGPSTVVSEGTSGSYKQIVGNIHSKRPEKFVMSIAKAKLFEHLLGGSIFRMMSRRQTLCTDGLK